MAIRTTISDIGVVQEEVEGASATVTLTGTQVIGGNLKVITAGKTLTADDSGAVLMPGGTAQTFVLPAAAAGLHFKMYAATAVAHAIQVPVSASARIYGNAINTNNASASAAEGQQVTNRTAVAFGTAFQTGDFMEVVCNGTNWFLHAVTNDPLTLT